MPHGTQVAFLLSGLVLFSGVSAQSSGGHDPNYIEGYTLDATHYSAPGDSITITIHLVEGNPVTGIDFALFKPYSYNGEQRVDRGVNIEEDFDTPQDGGDIVLQSTWNEFSSEGWFYVDITVWNGNVGPYSEHWSDEGATRVQLGDGAHPGDTTAPEVAEYTFDGETLERERMNDLQFRIQDDSPVHVSFNMYGDGGQGFMSFQGWVSGSPGDVVSVTKGISAQKPLGDYRIESVFLRDINGNQRSIDQQFTPDEVPDVVVTLVESDNPDRSPPHIKEFSFSTLEAIPGTTVEADVWLEDESGVRGARLSFYRITSGRLIEAPYIDNEDGDGHFHFSFTFPEDMEKGLYEAHFNAWDFVKNGGWATYPPGTESSEFTFNNDAENSDQDGDGVNDADDQCRWGDDADDFDGDGIPDECDPGDGPSDDSDGDGVSNINDVCPGDDGQEDLDQDGTPNNCDDDRDGDGIPNSDDPCPEFTSHRDANGDGTYDCAQDWDDGTHEYDSQNQETSNQSSDAPESFTKSGSRDDSDPSGETSGSRFTPDLSVPGLITALLAFAAFNSSKRRFDR